MARRLYSVAFILLPISPLLMGQDEGTPQLTVMAESPATSFAARLAGEPARRIRSRIAA